MKAIIMAGGEGTRLRPLTLSSPKPMATICTRPIIFYIIDLLIKNGFDHIVLTLRYLPHIITQSVSEYYKAKEVKITFSYEDEPLGTAGSVKQAAKDFKEPFLVISGDAMCDFDLRKIYQEHENSDADVSIVTTKVSDPREYGLVSQKNGIIKGFLEKPDFSHAISDLANTGIYVVSPVCLSLIPENQSYDFAKDLFPLMLEKNMIITSVMTNGYWSDIGDCAALLKTQKDLLQNKINVPIGTPLVSENGFSSVYSNDILTKFKNTFIEPFSYIGFNVDISFDTKIIKNSVIGDKTVIGSKCLIEGSSIGKSCFIGDNCTIKNTIIGDNSSVKSGSYIDDGVVIGSNVIIGKNSYVTNAAKIFDWRTIDDNSTIKSNMINSSAFSCAFDDDGIVGETGIELTSEFCAKIGRGAASIYPKSIIGIGCNGSESAIALKKALASGVLSASCDVWDYGDMFLSMFEYCASLSNVNINFFITSNETTLIKAVSQKGLPLSRETERKIEQSIMKEDYNRCDYKDFGKSKEMGSLCEIYKQNVTNSVKKSKKPLFENFHISIISNNLMCKNTCDEILKKLGCVDSTESVESSEKNAVTFNISNSGKKVFATIKSTGKIVIWEKLCALCMIDDFINKKDVYIPFYLPKIFEKISDDYSGKVFRYFLTPEKDENLKENQPLINNMRENANQSIYVNDGIFLIVKLLNFLKTNNITLEQALNMLPPFSLDEKELDFKGNVGSVIQDYIKKNNLSSEISEGIFIPKNDGYVYIVPNKIGTKFKIISQAINSESAKEITFDIEKEIKEKSKKTI